MLDYNTLVELVERIHKNIGVGSTVVLKGETADIKNLSKSTINKLKCGDIVVKKTGNQKHAYIVTYKEEKQGICLTYIDADCIETVSYDYTNGNWVYNSTDITSMPVLKAKQDALVSGENIKTIGGQSLLGSGNIDLQAGLSYELIWENPNDTIGTGSQLLFDNNVVKAKLILVEIINPNKYSTNGSQKTMWLCNVETTGKYNTMMVYNRSGNYGSYSFSVAGVRGINVNSSNEVKTEYEDNTAVGYNNIAVPKRIWKLA